MLLLKTSRRIGLRKHGHWLPAFVVILVVAITVAGCTGSSGIIPMPTAGNANPDKHYSPGGELPYNQIAIPFPYADNFKNGQERWYLEIDTSGHLVVRVTWKGLEVASFPANGFGINPSTGKIALDGKGYTVVSTHLNYASTPNSGWVVLQEN